ncbi:MAG: alanine dehydrogenase, partial [Pseudomonadota bacterium]|nr:alanine dehydrogenase [Pseudomonadota bacterium]
MRIGVPAEIKANEHRVGLVPSSVQELTAKGNNVYVETGAGHGIAAPDADYIEAGAEILETAEAVFQQAQMIVKVKEPQPTECA